MYDVTFGRGMRGEGVFADLLEKRFYGACKEFGLNSHPAPVLDTQSLKRKMPSAVQLDLWS